MFDLKDLGKAIRALRDRKTQKACAERVGLSPSAWSLYEAGKRNARPSMRERLARGLEVDLQVLEEKAWEMRNQRLATADAAEGKAAKVGGDAAGELLWHTVYEHLEGMSYHLQKAMLILTQHKRPLTP